MPAYAGNPRNPRHPVDFVDIVDIFRKSLKLLNFSLTRGVDILWIFSWTVDLSVDCHFASAQNEVFPKRKRFVNPELSSMAFPPFAGKKNIDSSG